MNVKPKYLAVLGVLIVLATVLFGRERFEMTVAGNPEDKVSVSELRNQFQSIVAVHDHSPASEIRAFDRGIATVVSRDFRAPASVETVLSEYVEELERQGWKKQSDRRTISSRVIKFCRGDVSANIDLIAEGSDTTFYYFGLTWASSGRDRAYCRENVTPTKKPE
jgi:hypothetical protein